MTDHTDRRIVAAPKIEPGARVKLPTGRGAVVLRVDSERGEATLQTVPELISMRLSKLVPVEAAPQGVLILSVGREPPSEQAAANDEVESP